MGGLLRPTTKAQVTGHAFLLKRVTHGLVFGDIRMIHEPLGARRRGLIFGLGVCTIGALGAVALAFLAPQPNPQDAPIVRTESGGLYAQIDGVYHPVVNLTSAHLIVGDAAGAVSIADEILAHRPKGVPLGIPDAPNTVPAGTPEGGDSPARAAGVEIGVCHHGHRTIITALPAQGTTARGVGSTVDQHLQSAVRALTPTDKHSTSALPEDGRSRAADSTASTTPSATAAPGTAVSSTPTPAGADVGAEAIAPFVELAPGHAILARGFGAQWLVTATGRARLPEDTTPEGIAIRRGLGITPVTPLWVPPEEVLAALRENPPLQVPRVRTLLTLPRDDAGAPGTAGTTAAGDEAPGADTIATFGILDEPEGRVVRLSATQFEILRMLPTPVRPAAPGELSHVIDSAALPIHLPEKAPGFIDPAAGALCVHGAQATVGTRALPLPQGVALGDGDTVSRYSGPGHSVLVDTGGGWWVISDTGRAHAVPTEADARALGWDPDNDTVSIPGDYQIVRLLPEGPALSREAASRPRY
ncbi:hypothetical protein C1Y63_05245 [Corynebacterium sp. 13CS0277]|uniref:type VII secretion protein EccB n=1 Tax=Corynebacterium sp. 13CS0277 TaxID=2071994 RepID=UPI000D03F5F9|nr:type VII secretion protein EccB [Corynebacterium sp. 13CS0277]PRQ11587.1 hypothetical protein C1Y63_05245 [Corynebacterium sp. 13CS0277]